MKTSLKIPAQKSPQIRDWYRMWTPFLTFNIFSKLGLEANIGLVEVRFPTGAVAAYLPRQAAQRKMCLSLNTCSSSLHGPQHCYKYTNSCMRHDMLSALPTIPCHTSANNPVLNHIPTEQSPCPLPGGTSLSNSNRQKWADGIELACRVCDL